jgi:hypothetical protein
MANVQNAVRLIGEICSEIALTTEAGSIEPRFDFASEAEPKPANKSARHCAVRKTTESKSFGENQCRSIGVNRLGAAIRNCDRDKGSEDWHPVLKLEANNSESLH